MFNIIKVNNSQSCLIEEANCFIEGKVSSSWGCAFFDISIVKNNEVLYFNSFDLYRGEEVLLDSFIEYEIKNDFLYVRVYFKSNIIAKCNFYFDKYSKKVNGSCVVDVKELASGEYLEEEIEEFESSRIC